MIGSSEIDARMDEACAWSVRLASDDADWAAFTAWLEADPANAAAYDQVALLEADLNDSLPDVRRLLPANDAEPAAPRRWFALGGGIAAALVAALIAVPMLQGGGATPGVSYVTGATGGRSVSLADGSTVRLDARTTVRVSGGPSPRIELASGAAYFDVRHDPARQLTVSAGGYEIRDVGTKFDVTRANDGVSVSVAEGEVSVAGNGIAGPEPVRAGERLDLNPASAMILRSAVAPDSVAAWRSGRLSYQDARLSLVAADVSRYAGRRVVADPQVAGLRFSGVVEIGDGSRLVERLEQFLPVDAVQSGGETRLVPRRTR